MLEELEEEYPEAVPFIREAVEAHGEDWVIDNYHPKISQLGVMMSVPDVEELPFYDEGQHEVMSDTEKQEMASAMRQYRENLKAGKKPDK